MSLRSSVLRWLVLFFVGLLLLYFLLAAVLAATWGRARVVTEVTALTGKQVTLASLHFNPLSNRVTLGGFSLADGQGELIGFDELTADLELLPLLEHEVRLRELLLVSPRVKVVLLADGKSVNLEQLVAQSAPAQPQAPAAQASTPFDLRISNLGISNGQVTFEDDSRAAKPSLVASHINFQARDLVMALDGSRSQPFAFQLALGLPEQGRVNLQGKITPVPLALDAKLTLQELALAMANGWLADVAKGQVAQGDLNGQFAITLAGDDARVNGDADADNFTWQTPEGEPLLGFGKLALKNLSLDTAAHAVSLDEVAVAELSGKLVSYADGSTSIDRTLVAAAPAAAPSATPSSTTPSSTTPAATSDAAPWRVQLGKLNVEAKELAFEDHGVTPAYQIHATPFKLSAGPFDSQSPAPADLDIDARLDGYAPFTVKGGVAAFAPQTAVNLRIDMNGYEMTQLTPYTGRFIGYKVQKGQLGVQSRLALKGTYLDSKNTVNAASFELGDKVQSKDAVKAPVKLGLSILRDGKGNINLPLNVSGDLADPGVSVPGLIMKAILNVLTKAATAPLSILSSLAGGVNLEQVAFDAGAKAPDLDGLKGLADVLTQRPALTLGLSGSTGEADVAFFTNAGLQGEALTDAVQSLADARARALKLALVDHYAVKPERLFLEQPQTQGKFVGVLLNAINQ